MVIFVYLFHNNLIIIIDEVTQDKRIDPIKTKESAISPNKDNPAQKPSALKNASSSVPEVPKIVSWRSDINGKKVNPTFFGHRQFAEAEAQKKRKEELIRKRMDKEQNELKFQFHAKPAPKIQKPAAQKQKSIEDKGIVEQGLDQKSNNIKSQNFVPSCGDPERLKSAAGKKEMLIAKHQEIHVQFKAKPAAVLKKQPFQPVHDNIKVVDQKPFKLQLTTRLQQRSEFDNKLKETIAVRAQQEEILKQLRDLEERKLTRQRTEFHANPIRRYR